MSNLNQYQKLDWAVPGKPFGTGGDGSTTITTDPCTRATVTGGAGGYTSTIGATILTNGDAVLLHQTQYTGAGHWEFARVASGGGTTSITWTRHLNYSYVGGAQVIKFPMYNALTVNAHSATSWNGSTGGIEVLCGRTSIGIGGAVSINGGSASGYSGGSGGGFYGGDGFYQAGGSHGAYYGE